MMDAYDIIQRLIKSYGITQEEIAEKLGTTPQKISGRFMRKTLRVEDMFDIFNVIGVDLRFFDRSTGEEIPIIDNGRGRRVKCMVKGVHYDTKKCRAICDNFGDGPVVYKENSRELYVTPDGTYFLTKYGVADGAKDKIEVIDDVTAQAFIAANTTVY